MLHGVLGVGTRVPCCEGHSEVSQGVTASPTTAMTTATQGPVVVFDAVKKDSLNEKSLFLSMKYLQLLSHI